jgi:hypothetical protein
MPSSLLFALTALVQSAAPQPPLHVQVDSARWTVTLTYRVPESEARGQPFADGSHGHGHAHAHIERMERTAWPVSGWIRGARVELTDADGAPLPQSRLHHANLLNFERAQLVHPGVERLWGAGRETDPVLLPAGIGVPIDSGTAIGLVVAFIPGDLPADARIQVVFAWTPRTFVPRPVDMLPVSLTIGYRPDGSSAYDVPPGRSEQAFEFVAPLGGRIIGAGGHLHDGGAEVRLEDGESGKVLVRLCGVHDAEGRLTGVERKLYGITGRGKKIEAGRRYRVVAVYESSSDERMVAAGMASLGLAFVPDRLEAWPHLDSDSDAVRVDLAHLATFERTPGLSRSE